MHINYDSSLFCKLLLIKDSDSCFQIKHISVLILEAGILGKGKIQEEQVKSSWSITRFV